MSIALAKKYIPVLDEIYKRESLTSILDGADDLVREGANAGELLIPKMDMSGMGDYSRTNGYVNGSVDLTWETVSADYDRGRMFQVDVLDDQETFNVAFGRLAGEFIRTKSVPEADAFTFAKIAGTSGVGGTSGTLASGADVISALRAATSAMDEAEVPEEDRVLYITPTLLGLVEDLDTTKSREVLARFNDLYRVPQTRFYTAIDLYDGSTSGETAGGYIKDATSGKDINFLAVSRSAICKFSKHVAPKIITPEQNQNADAWKYGYRHVLVVKVYDNKKAGVYCHHKA